jgi:hypothetical protein
VQSVTISAVGAAGGGASVASGRGASITDTFTVTPGQILYVEVGGVGVGVGVGTDPPAPSFNGGGAGGARGAEGSNGAAGGGATDVRTTNRAATGTLDTRLIVAAGGGGAGGGDAGNGEAGGDAGADGGGSHGGGGATQVEGGTSYGVPTAAFGVGGDGDSNGEGAGGGGGGGGYFGGGGGSSGSVDPTAGPTHPPGYGGGGGSSYSGAGAMPILSSASASVTITPGPIGPAAVTSPAALSFSPTAPGSISPTQTVTVTSAGDMPLHVGAVTVAGPQAADFVIASTTCTQPLPVGASCTIGVRFAPSTAHASTASLQVASDDDTSPTTVALTGSTPSPPPPSTPPELSQLRLSPSRFRAANQGATIAALPVGTTVRYRDTLNAITTFTVSRKTNGIRRGRSCVATPHHHKRGQRSCTRLVTIGSFTHEDRTGTNQFHFTGRVSIRGRVRALPAGNYLLSAVSRIGTLASRQTSSTFTIST